MIAKRAQACKASQTLAIAAKAAAMKAAGDDVVEFGAGQPDFPPPEFVKEAAIAAVKNDKYAKYTAASGMPELKKKIAEKLKKDNHIDYAAEQVSVNVGAKHSCYNICMAVLDEGDEVIIPKPYWVSYPEMVKLAGGKCVYIDTDKEYILRAEAVEMAITKKTKMLILNSPSNPSGAVIDEKEIRKIAEVVRKHKIYVLSDEIYEEIIYEGKHFSIASLSPELKDLTFTVNGLSKSHAIPGWRLGYIAGPLAEIKAINNIQSHSTSNPTSIVQVAAMAAFDGSKDILHSRCAEFKKRRDFIVKKLNEIKGVHCPLPGGAFYVFPKIPLQDDFKFASELLEKEKVALVPGVEFGMEGYVRISYACSLEEIRKGVERMKKFIEQ